MDSFKTEIESFITDLQEIAQMVAPVAAMIGIITAAVLHFGAHLPVINKMKQNNPDLTSNMVTGFFLLFIASGAVSLISFT